MYFNHIIYFVEPTQNKVLHNNNNNNNNNNRNNTNNKKDNDNICFQ